MSDFREASSGHKTDVSRSNDCNIHTPHQKTSLSDSDVHRFVQQKVAGSLANRVPDVQIERYSESGEIFQGKTQNDRYLRFS
jgi:hypothetical protein